METEGRMVQEFEQAAWTMAEIELDEQSWATLRQQSST